MTKEIKGIAIILAVYLGGELTSRMIGGFIPGSVLGMLLLFGLLNRRVVKEDDIKSVAEFMLKNMMLFFVPISVGLMASLQIIGDNWFAIIVTLLVTTLLVMIVVGLVQQKLSGKWKK